MKILYIFPHPDDESFGPARAMSKQRRQGHEVYLLTLTRGGATKQRFKFGYSVEKMCEVRYNEMLKVGGVLDLSGLTILDLPDSGLKEMDPREIERVIIREIKHIQPQVVVTYAVHGISGFHDHLVTHAVVKRVFAKVKEENTWLKRLAFYTITTEEAEKSPHFHLNGSTSDEIDCIFKVDTIDIETNQKALDCYVTFQEIIEKTGIRDFLYEEVTFEVFQKNYYPPLNDLFDRIE